LSPREPMKARTVRVSDAVWDAAMAASVERGENLSDELRKFLIRYAGKKSGK
jgi:hypothetical protein